MATILVTGGTGMIGSALTAELTAREHRVIVLSRRPRPSSHPRVRYAAWDPAKGEIDREALGQADAIVHLAGANVAEKRWTAKRKAEIVNSRVESGRLIIEALRTVPNSVRTVVSASAIGWYGPDPSVPNPRPFVEADAAAADFLGTTCRQWEEAIAPAQALGKRLVILRTGIVLSRAGGAYKEFRKPLRMGLATVLGSGTQVVSWIHISDLVRLYVAAVEESGMRGIYNAVAPQPVSNRRLVQAIAEAAGRPHVRLGVPAPLLKLALGEMSIEVLKSATVSSARLEREGFSFFFPSVEAAAKNLEGNANVII